MTMSSNLLLPEILSRIFSFLHIEDRKTVRLVCKKWNDCYNCPQILRREKFVFRAGSTLENIDLFLRNCEKIRLSVEFQGLDLDKLSDDIWQIIGENIFSLKLFECTGTTKVTKNIFLHCLNMYSFESFGLSITSYSPALWDELIQLNIERRKMIVFHLFLSGKEELSKDVLRKIFKIFPSICNFGTGYPTYAGDHFGHSDQVSLLNTFNPALIREFIFNVPSSGLWIQELSKVPELKLQKLETILINPTVSQEIFAQFLQNQRELKTLNIMVWKNRKTDYTKMLLSKILSICSELIDLRFKSDTDLKIDEFCRAIRIVSESKLECFMLWIRYAYNFENDTTFRDHLSTYLPRSTNKRLRTLKLFVGRGLPEEYCLPILQHFYDLRHLEIAAASDKVLQTIFKYHIHLQILVLCKLNNCTTFGFTGYEWDSSVVQEKSYSISRLQELKYLEVEGFLGELHLCVEKIMRHFNFPRLKYLRLNLWEMKKISLQFLPAMIPLVEVLIINNVPSHVDEYSFLCQDMQRLKFLSCPLLEEKKFIENLFVVRPSLKYVVDRTGNNYFYDRLSKALSSVDFLPLELVKC